MKDFASIRVVSGRQVLAQKVWDDEDDDPSLALTYQHQDGTSVTIRFGFSNGSLQQKAFDNFTLGLMDEFLVNQIKSSEASFQTEAEVE